MRRIGRREFIKLGAITGSALAAGGLSGCAESAPVAEAEKPVDQQAVGQELEQAKSDWVDAFALVGNSWQTLQDSTKEAESYLEIFKTEIVLNPDALGEFERTIAEAKATKDLHGGKTIPAELADILSSRDELAAIANAYDTVVENLYSKLNAVEFFDPSTGEFDVTDKDGYSYHVSYNLSPKISTDSTEGKPGQVALFMDTENCSVTIKNTTPGKKAPSVMFNCAPLYSADRFSDVIEDLHDLATFGPLATPVTLSASTINRDILDLEYERAYVNPFDNDMQGGMSSSSYSDFGYIANIDIQAGVRGTANQSYQISSGQELAVGESRVFSVNMEFNGKGSRFKLGEIKEEYVERFRKISGWAVYPLLRYSWPMNTIYFKGNTNKSSDFGDDICVYTYNPVTGAR